MAVERSLRAENTRLARELEDVQRLAHEAQEQSRAVLRRIRTAWQQVEAAAAQRIAAVELFAELLSAHVHELDGGLMSVDSLREACLQLCVATGVKPPPAILEPLRRSVEFASPVQLQREVDTLQTGLVVLSLEMTGCERAAHQAAAVVLQLQRKIAGLEQQLQVKEFESMAAEATLRELRRDFSAAVRAMISASGEGRVASSRRSTSAELERSAAYAAAARTLMRAEEAAKPASGQRSEAGVRAADGGGFGCVGGLEFDSPKTSTSRSARASDAAAELAQLDEDIGWLTARLRRLVGAQSA
ncbi:hypothetical protein KFE25_013770 [Diacronema lutheri]|uniref:Uncharacterized protein n=2 Tax=Diacronema lutheri TaxID=2081491 RepID=A0A8J5XUF1_DIALT|nr:hypothetical protein KFE25_013770 [Diacronema lutheri]